jgi:hypothetical protein
VSRTAPVALSHGRSRRACTAADAHGVGWCVCGGGAGVVCGLIGGVGDGCSRKRRNVKASSKACYNASLLCSLHHPTGIPPVLPPCTSCCPPAPTGAFLLAIDPLLIWLSKWWLGGVVTTISTMSICPSLQVPVACAGRHGRRRRRGVRRPPQRHRAVRRDAADRALPLAPAREVGGWVLAGCSCWRPEPRQRHLSAPAWRLPQARSHQPPPGLPPCLPVHAAHRAATRRAPGCPASPLPPQTTAAWLQAMRMAARAASTGPPASAPAAGQHPSRSGVKRAQSCQRSWRPLGEVGEFSGGAWTQRQQQHTCQPSRALSRVLLLQAGRAGSRVWGCSRAPAAVATARGRRAQRQVLGGGCVVRQQGVVPLCGARTGVGGAAVKPAAAPGARAHGWAALLPTLL